MYTWEWGIISQYQWVFIEGALVTLCLTLLVVITGTLLGVAIGIIRPNLIFPFSLFIKIYIELFRALPILVLLIWIYYVLPILVDVRLSPFIAGYLALSINLSAYVAETVRAGIEAIPKNQYESGITLGFTRSQVMWRLILPQAIRSMLPNLLGLYITQLKNSSLTSVIAVNELLHQSNSVISNTYRPLEVYTAVAGIYVAIILPITFLCDHVERMLAKKTKQL